MIQLQWTHHELRLPVKVTPKGGRDCLLPYSEGDVALKLKVSSPPEDGKANAAVIALLSDLLQVSRNRLKIIQGEKSRQKRVAVRDVAQAELEPLVARLAQTLQTTPELALKMVE